MNNFLSELRYAWKKPNGTLERLMIVNIAVFIVVRLIWVGLALFAVPGIYETIEMQLMMSPRVEVFLFKPWTLVTYFFFHTDFWHILMNILMLYWFGCIFRNFLSGYKLLSIYILGGIAGGLVYLLAYNVFPIFEERIDLTSGLLGASAGVLAVVVATAVFVPNYKMQLLFIGSVSIKYIAFVLVFLSIIGTAGANGGGDFAHLGGAFMGYLFIVQARRGRDIGKWITKTLNCLNGMLRKIFSTQSIKLTRKKSHFKVHYGGKKTWNVDSNAVQEDPPITEELDKILDKISESGYEMLTEREKKLLFEASQTKNHT